MLRITTAFILAILVAPVTLAQTTGAIEGRVTDREGVPLPGATVTASSPSLQGLQVSSSSRSGLFRLPLLPPGTYTVRFALSGFSPVEQEAITVGLGRTVTLYVRMPDAFAEEVTVTGAPPTVDVTSTEVGANITSDLFLSLPTERSYTSIFRVAPGTSDDKKGTMVYGSSGAENSYYIDGLNVSEIRYGVASKELNFEFVQEIQVKTGGYQAEYGRSTGGLVKLIMKSGGNEFHGDVFGFYYDHGLQSHPKPEIIAYRRERAPSNFETGFTESDMGADLGGYLLRDRLWFFAAYDRVRRDADWQVSQDFSPYGGPPEGAVYVRRSRRDLWAAKVTWRLGQSHSVVAETFGDPATVDGPQFPLNGAETSFLGTYETGGNDGLLRWDGVLGGNLVVSAQASRHADRDIISGPGARLPGVADRTTPLTFATGMTYWSEGFGEVWDRRYTRDLYRADLAYYAGGFAGDHELKIGAEVEDVRADFYDEWSGGRYYQVLCATGHLTEQGCAPEWTYYRHFLQLREEPPGGLTDPNIADYVVAGLRTKPKHVNDGAYLQDSWQVLPNLTLDLGLRWERQRIYDADGNVQIDIDNEWAPRLGIVWDFRGNGSSKLYGSWGRFYETIPMDLAVRSFLPSTLGSTYNLDPSSLVCDPSFHEIEPSSWIGCSVNSVSDSAVDPAGVKGQYIEEAILGAELEVAPDLALGAKLIWRNLGRVVEDSVAPDFSYYIGNPGSGRLSQAVDMWTYFLYPVAKAKRTFKGLELVARKRYSDNWQLIASYLWSKLEGNYDGTFQASTGQLDPNLNSSFDFAEFQVNNYGYLTNDRRHQLKLDATYRFRFGLDLGLSTYYRTGIPVTAMGYSSYYSNQEFYLSQRGQWARTSPEYEIDLHLGYPIRVRGVQVNLLLDVFNLLNRQGETSRDTRYDLDEIHGVIDYSTGTYLPPIPNGTPCTSTVPAGYASLCNSGFNKADDWQKPRRIRLGVRVTF